MTEYKFPYLDDDKQLHVIVIEAKSPEEALIAAVEELHEREDQA
jgi:hypothetical protein